MRMSSNSPLVAPDGAGSWLMKTRSLSRFFDSSAPVPPVAPFFPVEKITATALVVRVVLVPEQVVELAPAEVVQIRRSGEGVLGSRSVNLVRIWPWVVNSAGGDRSLLRRRESGS